MKWDIVNIKNQYRGTGRVLSGTDLCTRRTKRVRNYLLDMYFEYISYLLKEISREEFIKIIDFCKEFNKYEIKYEVELIVYDECPLESAFGYDLEFLGIDITHDLAESLLEDPPENVKRILNENGLCFSKEDVGNIVPLLDHGDVNWEPCYVYKVKY